MEKVSIYIKKCNFLFSTHKGIKGNINMNNGPLIFREKNVRISAE